ncbi:MAG: S-methyl-5'-thioadenosine phosphorylase, partial [Candidatus Micrarchaeia archaeon]
MLGVIGGSGFYKLAGAEARREDTPYGIVSVSRGRKIVFVPRHGERHELPPHRVNHKANIYALKKAGASAILGINACGLIAKFKPGDIMTIDDFIAFHLGPITYFESFEKGARHTDMSEPYSKKMNAEIAKAGKKAGVVMKSGG